MALELGTIAVNTANIPGAPTDAIVTIPDAPFDGLLVAVSDGASGDPSSRWIMFGSGQTYACCADLIFFQTYTTNQPGGQQVGAWFFSANSLPSSGTYPVLYTKGYSGDGYRFAVYPLRANGNGVAVRQWKGFGTVNSADVTVVVDTPAVSSSFLVGLASNGNNNSYDIFPFVNSLINDGGGPAGNTFLICHEFNPTETTSYRFRSSGAANRHALAVLEIVDIAAVTSDSTISYESFFIYRAVVGQ